ncbi:endoglucanase-like [Dreissena polymorpha]|uniref:Cellulase n=1 Tax=Dreissena polymorpha TaxID=45954 RepID=A0A9D4JR41_DREPO|nr:endoglucanase-like [Dreissena polymorpha]KAH3821256.1 hypothetical protein DPMN_123019 [Dreissena polymorpha]
MKVCLTVVLLCFGAWLTDANPLCTGSPKMLNGKMCASTTRYADGNKGACGCGPSSGNNQFPWAKSAYLASANQALFDCDGKTWCGQACGKCVKLTTTGGFVSGQGAGTAAGQTKVFMIANLCPIPPIGSNPNWCNQVGTNGVNQYGYGWHFSLENGDNQITGMNWDNPEVTWEWTNCDLGNLQDARTPTYCMYRQCQCRDAGKK